MTHAKPDKDLLPTSVVLVDNISIPKQSKEYILKLHLYNSAQLQKLAPHKEISMFRKV